MKIAFGIDFGTTNSALSVYRDGRIEIIPVDSGEYGGELMRSVLYFNDENEIFAGHEAIRQYLWEGASGRFMQSIKTFLPNTSFVSTEIFGRKYTIEDLVAIILRQIKERGERFVGCQVDTVVLGRPVYFSTDPLKHQAALQRLENAARKAGFRDVILQYEPVAAALAYEETMAGDGEKTVFIGDFGGGTSDFSIIRVGGASSAGSERLKDVLSLGGLYIAGDRFDSQVMWDRVACYFGRDARYRSFGSDEWLNVPKGLVYTLSQWHRIPLLRTRKNMELIRLIKSTADNRAAIQNLENIINDNYGFFLFQAIEKTKCDLTAGDDAVIEFTEKDLQISQPISRTEFEQLNRDNFDRIEACVDEVLKSAGLSAGQIDTVFLTGGTSRIPYIKRIFAERFGWDRLNFHNDFTSVVRGLAASVPGFEG
jgi:hypothetical chaperone protein